MFDEKTQSALQAYVYMLIDPRSNKPFYIGKGNNNRVFDHLNCAIDVKNNDISNLKYDTIRELNGKGIEPIHMIVRHGLTDEHAFQVECALIDALKYLGANLTNAVGGHNSIEKGIMSTSHIKARYQAAPLEEISSDCVIININKTYSRSLGQNAIYEATKGVWRMKNPSGKIKIVLSEYHGLIVEVFDVDEWYSEERGYGSNAKKAGEKYLGYGFNGCVAPEETRRKYIYKSIAHLKKKGAANVIRYSA